MAETRKIPLALLWLAVAACSSPNAENAPGPGPGGETPMDSGAPGSDNGSPRDVRDAGSSDTCTPVCDLNPPDGSNPPGPNQGRFGFACGAVTAFAFGDGALLICDQGKWRYALRGDVPDGTYGGFTRRPDWYPRLGAVFNLPAASCRAALTQLPIAESDVTTIVPYGLMVGSHVTPIDHMYIGVSPLALDPAARQSAAYVPVRAPADGVIIEASSLGSTTSMRVVIPHGCETVSIYMVLNQLAGVLAPYQDQVSAGGNLRLDLPIKTGDLFALQRDNPMDFSLHDGAAWLSGFAHPFPYTSGDAWKPYTVDPLPYFPAAVATLYADKMQRVDAPRVGRIDYDRAGSAVGNWYLEGTIGYSGRAIDEVKNATGSLPGGMVSGKNGYSWSHLSLAPHWVYPSVWMASLGTFRDPAGDFPQLAIRPGPIMPDTLTPADDVAVYELSRWTTVGPNDETIDYMNLPVGYHVKINDGIEGVLAVRVNADNTLTVEKRPDLTSAADFSGFSTLAETYWR